MGEPRKQTAEEHIDEIMYNVGYALGDKTHVLVPLTDFQWLLRQAREYHGVIEDE